MLLKT